MVELSGPGLDDFLLDGPLTEIQVRRIEELLTRAYQKGASVAEEFIK